MEQKLLFSICPKELVWQKNLIYIQNNGYLQYKCVEKKNIKIQENFRESETLEIGKMYDKMSFH